PPPDPGTPTTPPRTTPPPPTSGSGITVSTSSLTSGTTQGTQSVTDTNKTSGKVTFMTATLSSGRYTQSNSCGEVAAGASCTATVTYPPNVSGSNTGTYTLTSTAPNSPHVVTLSASGGTTTTPPPTTPPPT